MPPALPTSHYEAVSELYLRCRAERVPALATIAARWNVPTSTAAAWVRRAKRRGLLVPAESPRDRFDRLVDRSGSEFTCWPWTGYLRDGTARGMEIGHGRFQYEGRLEEAHRVAWMLEHGPIPDGLKVLHICDFPPCCNPRHLYLGTLDDNMRDREIRQRVRHACGEENGNAKVTAEDVVAIRRRSAEGESGTALGHAYGLSASQIGRIVKGAQWRDTATDVVDDEHEAG